MAPRNCFLCIKEIEMDESEGESTQMSFNEESAFVMLHILEVPHLENLTTRSKFNEAVYCPPCAQKIKEIKNILEDLSELEKLVLERKQEVEKQLRESWEKVRKKNEGLDPEDRFREQVVTELNSNKLLSTLTRIRENRIGRKFCTSSERENAQRQGDQLRLQNYEETTPSSREDLENEEENINISVDYESFTGGESHSETAREFSPQIGYVGGQPGNPGRPGDAGVGMRHNFILSDIGSVEGKAFLESRLGHGQRDQEQRIAAERMDVCVEPDSLFNRSAEEEESYDDYPPEFAYPEVKYDPLAEEEGNPATTVMPSASFSRNSPSNYSSGAFVVESHPVDLPSNNRVEKVEIVKPSTSGTIGRRDSLQRREYPSDQPKKSRQLNSWQLDIELENKAQADAFISDMWCAKDTKLYPVGLTRYFYCKSGGQGCPASLKLVFYSKSTKVGVFTNGKRHSHEEKFRVSGLPNDLKEIVETLVKSGVTKPTEILYALRRYEVPIPAKTEIVSFLQAYRRST